MIITWNKIQGSRIVKSRYSHRIVENAKNPSRIFNQSLQYLTYVATYVHCVVASGVFIVLLVSLLFEENINHLPFFVCIIWARLTITQLIALLFNSV